MNGPRRHLLAASGGLLASLAGCVSASSGGPASASETTDGERTATTATRDYPATVEANATIDREEVEYVEENDTVRYVAAYGSKDRDGDDDSPPEREPIYETMPFDEWAEVECASVGSKRVYDVMADRLDGEIAGVSAGIGREDGEMVVRVAHRTTLDRDGEVVSEPSVPYERVKQVTPRKVAVDLTFDGREHHCVVRVKTRQIEVRQE